MRKEQKEATRRKLIDAAKECFAQGHSLAVTDVAKRAGVAAGTFYVHFADRDALVDELVMDVNLGAQQELAKVLRRNTHGAMSDAMRDFARAYLRNWRRNAHFIPLFREHHARRAEALTQRYNDWFQSIAPVLAYPGDLSMLGQGIGAIWRMFGMQTEARPARQDTQAAELLASMTVGILRAELPLLVEMDAVFLGQAIATVLEKKARY